MTTVPPTSSTDATEALKQAWPLWATLTPDQIREQLREDHLAEHLKVFAVLASQKYARIRIAVDLLRGGVALLVLATAVKLATVAL